MAHLSFLYGTAAVAAFSAVAYELLLASYATFLLGASIFQYSLVISFMMASMGVGALLAGRAEKHALQTFFVVEVVLALVAVIALPVLYYAFAKELAPKLIVLTFVFILGTSIGMEIPLLNFINGTEKGLPRILFFDYLGGFAGGIAFPLWLLPHLGFFRMAGVLACLNAALAILMLWVFKRDLRKNRALWMAVVAATATLAVSFLWGAEPIRHFMELKLFDIHPVPG